MKVWMFVLSVVLLAVIASGAFLFNGTNSSLQDTQAQLALLRDQLATLENQPPQAPAPPPVPATPTPPASIPAVSSSTLSVADAIAKIAPAVVRIDVTTPKVQGEGSGVIINTQGLVLTAQHVIDQVTSIKVTIMTGQQYSASVVASDKTRDVAVLKLNTTRSDFPSAELGSSSAVIIGQEVVTAGFPIGTDLEGPATFTRGIVSAVRVYQGLNYLQTDAVVNPGNSGGCLITLDAKVIGIVDAEIVPPRSDAENINFCIPIDEAKPIIQSASN